MAALPKGAIDTDARCEDGGLIGLLRIGRIALAVRVPEATRCMGSADED
jgi:hypothetical protein